MIVAELKKRNLLLELCNVGREQPYWRVRTPTVAEHNVLSLEPGFYAVIEPDIGEILRFTDYNESCW